jgi:hypothetical protein
MLFHAMTFHVTFEIILADERFCTLLTFVWLVSRVAVFMITEMTAMFCTIWALRTFIFRITFNLGII